MFAQVFNYRDSQSDNSPFAWEYRQKNYRCMSASVDSVEIQSCIVGVVDLSQETFPEKVVLEAVEEKKTGFVNGYLGIPSFSNKMSRTSIKSRHCPLPRPVCERKKLEELGIRTASKLALMKEEIAKLNLARSMDHPLCSLGIFSPAKANHAVNPAESLPLS